MPLLQLGVGFSPCQIDEFPKDCARSREGSIHLRPRSLESVTDDELDHILASKPALRRFVVVLPAAQPHRPAKARPSPKFSDKPAAQPDPEPEAKELKPTSKSRREAKKEAALARADKLKDDKDSEGI